MSANDNDFHQGIALKIIKLGQTYMTSYQRRRNKPDNLLPAPTSTWTRWTYDPPSLSARVEIVRYGEPEPLGQYQVSDLPSTLNTHNLYWRPVK